MEGRLPPCSTANKPSAVLNGAVGEKKGGKSMPRREPGFKPSAPSILLFQPDPGKLSETATGSWSLCLHLDNIWNTAPGFEASGEEKH